MVKIDVPKNHPGLPRLLEATKRLPDVVFQNQSGVCVHKTQLWKPGIFEEFFDALAEVTGRDMVEDIVRTLGLKERLDRGRPEDLLGVAQGLFRALPLADVLSMVRR